MALRLGAQILQDSNVVLINLASKASKVQILGQETLSFIYPLNNMLLTVDEQKFLSAWTVAEDLTASFKSKLKLSKKLTHGWVSGQRFYYWDKFGDIYSLSLEDLYNAPEFVPAKVGENAILDTSFLTQESGNFSTLTAFSKLTLNISGENKQYIALSDEYYKIRLFEFPEMHHLATNLAWRKRFVTGIFPVGLDTLLVLFDDNKFFRIPKSSILEADDTDIVEVSLSEDLQTLIQGKTLEILDIRNGNEVILLVGSDNIYKAKFDAESNSFSGSTEQVYGAGENQDGISLVLEQGGVFDLDASNCLHKEIFVASMDSKDYVVKGVFSL